MHTAILSGLVLSFAGHGPLVKRLAHFLLSTLRFLRVVAL
jgi:hypothetical protein